MKFTLLLIWFVLSTFKVFACELVNSTRHTNPDGSLGGRVNNRAQVAPTAFVASGAKICGFAQIDGNAQILNSAVVKENAWVKSYSIVKDRAVISGHALISGGQNRIATIQGTSKIYGNAKIMSGSIVQDSAEVFGGAILESSVVTGESKVCFGAVISNEQITDDYFCDTAFATSRAEIKLENLSEDKFNITPKRVIVSSTYEFLQDKTANRISINGSNVDTAFYEIYGKRLIVTLDSQFADGPNQIEFSGKDKFGKEIGAQTFEIFTGSDVKFIQSSMTGKERVEAFTNIDGKEIQIPANVSTAGIRLYGIPSESFLEYRVELRAVGEKTYLLENFSNTSFPESLELTRAPEFINNNSEYGANLNAWEINQPELVQEDGQDISLTFSSDPLVLSKQFVLSDSKASASLEMAPFDAGTIFDENYEIEMAFVSFSTKKIDSRRVNLAELSALYGSDVGIKHDYLKKFSKNERILSLLKLTSKDPAIKFQAKSKSKSVPLGDVEITFTPYNYSVLNDTKAIPKGLTTPDSILLYARRKSTPLSSIESETDCNDPSFKTNLSRAFKPQADLMEYFSVGDALHVMPNYSENRIYGNLSFGSMKKKDLSDIRLVFIGYSKNSNKVVRLQKGLAACYLRQFNELSEDSEVSFNVEHSLVKPLFYFLHQELLDFDTSGSSKIKLRVIANFNDNGVPRDIKSRDIDLKVLITPYALFANTSNTYGTVDDYDSQKGNILRTGGDKWILPAYSDMVINILNNGSSANVNWQMGDLTKSNGGVFLPHTDTHKDGQDADIRYPDSQAPAFILSKLKDEEWPEVLNRIENFLRSFQNKFKYIRDIYISLPSDLARKDWRFLEMKFGNTCFSNLRYIQFKQKNGQRSLLRNVGNHDDHVHIRFNETTDKGTLTNYYDLTDTPTNEIDDFEFSLGQDGNGLSVKWLPGVNISKKYIAWRFQSKKMPDSDEVNPVIDYKMNFEYGPGGDKYQGTANQAKRYIYLTIASAKTGACVQREIEIDPSKVVGGMKWTYQKRDGEFKVLPLQ